MPRTVGVLPKAYNLKVTLSGGTSGRTTLVRTFNRTTHEFRDVTATSNVAVVNVADLSSDGTSNGTFSGWSNGDVLEVRVYGGRYGSNTHTISLTATSGGSVTVTVTDLSATTNPGFNV